MLMGHDLGTEASYFKPSERELAETWRKYENALRLDVDTEADERVALLEKRVEVLTRMVKTMAEDLIEAVAEDPAKEKSQLPAERLGADLMSIVQRIGPDKVEREDLRELLLTLGGIYGKIKKG
jgi:hypothetical protein